MSFVCDLKSFQHKELIAFLNLPVTATKHNSLLFFFLTDLKMVETLARVVPKVTTKFAIHRYGVVEMSNRSLLLCSLKLAKFKNLVDILDKNVLTESSNRTHSKASPYAPNTPKKAVGLKPETYALRLTVVTMVSNEQRCTDTTCMPHPCTVLWSCTKDFCWYTPKFILVVRVEKV